MVFFKMIKILENNFDTIFYNFKQKEIFFGQLVTSTHDQT